MNRLFDFDKDKLKDFDYIIGTDEAGRGPGAGPVFAAAVCFDIKNKKLIKLLADLNDSKQLTQKKREELYEYIVNNSLYGISEGSVKEIEEKNILKTSLMAMNKACLEVISKLDSERVLILVDGNRRIPEIKYNQMTVVKGDAKSASIAAASVIAKVSRDNLMIKLDKKYPMYNWIKNKGYMTKEHLDAVDKYGLCEWHRKKFFEKHFNNTEQLKLVL